jgi:hypothetical protein
MAMSEPERDWADEAAREWWHNVGGGTEELATLLRATWADAKREGGCNCTDCPKHPGERCECPCGAHPYSFEAMKAERDAALADAEEARAIVSDLFPGEHGDGLRAQVLKVINERDAAYAQLRQIAEALTDDAPDEDDDGDTADGEPHRIADFAVRAIKLRREEIEQARGLLERWMDGGAGDGLVIANTRAFLAAHAAPEKAKEADRG